MIVLFYFYRRSIAIFPRARVTRARSRQRRTAVHFPPRLRSFLPTRLIGLDKFRDNCRVTNHPVFCLGRFSDR